VSVNATPIGAMLTYCAISWPHYRQRNGLLSAKSTIYCLRFCLLQFSSTFFCIFVIFYYFITSPRQTCPVCASTSKTRFQTSPHFSLHAPGGLGSPVLWMTSCFHVVMAMPTYPNHKHVLVCETDCGDQGRWDQSLMSTIALSQSCQCVHFV